ncbi:hypothetical protein TCAL_12745 [Tigriopus californicus]|uniref:Uncharacterized protein n=1 Tax=Tigriopus californicus TaxID=6832 RepID=A0A553PJW2_TIGCA|nr:hypothetical protein TCAL_12745 [Tigriopus californicus]|eukprot:TCALIF_12745-PA protein Name:"Protein of unknown function" AED:0.46 eAED:0.50 QI:0/-1/0/1/-1/1/1/0/98
MATPTLRILQNLPLTDADRGDPLKVIQALGTHIEGDTNYRVYRQQFYSRRRRDGEPFDDCIIALRDIAQKCNFTHPPILTVMEDRILDMVIMELATTK